MFSSQKESNKILALCSPHRNNPLNFSMTYNISYRANLISSNPNINPKYLPFQSQNITHKTELTLSNKNKLIIRYSIIQVFNVVYSNKLTGFESTVIKIELEGLIRRS